MNLRLDRSAFIAGKLEDQQSHQAYWLAQSPMDRLNAAWFIICQAYKLDPDKQHKLDRSIFSAGKQ